MIARPKHRYFLFLFQPLRLLFPHDLAALFFIDPAKPAVLTLDIAPQNFRYMPQEPDGICRRIKPPLVRHMLQQFLRIDVPVPNG